MSAHNTDQRCFFHNATQKRKAGILYKKRMRKKRIRVDRDEERLILFFYVAGDITRTIYPKRESAVLPSGDPAEWKILEQYLE